MDDYWVLILVIVVLVIVSTAWNWAITPSHATTPDDTNDDHPDHEHGPPIG